jgi:thiol-disulfide isomerase/thioredoxin
MIIELVKDNLEHYMDIEHLLVVYNQKGCGACNALKPHLFELDKKYSVVMVEAFKYPKSCNFLPGGINFYPTIGLFERGYFVKEINFNDIINKKFK